MRLCMVNERKAMFHCWQPVSEVLSPSPMRGGHQGGTLRYTVGIIEYENGEVEEVAPKNIVFLDSQKLMQRTEKEIVKWEARQVTADEERISEESRLAAFRPDKSDNAEDRGEPVIPAADNSRSFFRQVFKN